MSNTNGRPVDISGATLVWAIAAMFIAVVAAIVALAIGLPESQNPAGLAAQLLSSFAALVAVLGVMFRVSRMDKKLDDQGKQVDRAVEQTNGGLDSRVRRLAYESTRRALVDHLDKDKLEDES